MQSDAALDIEPLRVAAVRHLRDDLVSVSSCKRELKMQFIIKSSSRVSSCKLTMHFCFAPVPNELGRRFGVEGHALERQGLIFINADFWVVRVA